VTYGGGFEFQSFPGGYDEVISVGATSYSQEKADYSNYGEWTELVAPVGDEGTGIRSIEPSGGYYFGWGTSFAAPQVAAVVALMKSLNNSLRVSEIREILHKTAIDLGEGGKDIYFGYGLLNASAAVKEVLFPSQDKHSNLVWYIVIPIVSIVIIAAVVILILVKTGKLKLK
ncbi:unnamed protein product, partial [marine sediment metagenome]